MNINTFFKFNRIAIFIFIGFITLQISCQKEEKNIEILDTLNGTVWGYTSYLNATDTLYNHTLVFTESTFTWTVKDYYYSETNISKGTYTYSYPNVKLLFSDGSYNDAVISGNKMSIDGNEGMDFTKQ